MGSRGAFFNKAGKGRLIDKKWHTVATIRGVQVLDKNDKNASKSLPTMSAQPNSKYAIFNKDGSLKQIAYYGEDREILRQVDFDHSHKGKQPHAHDWINGKRIDSDLTDKDKDYKYRLEKWRKNTTRRF